MIKIQLEDIDIEAFADGTCAVSFEATMESIRTMLAVDRTVMAPALGEALYDGLARAGPAYLEDAREILEISEKEAGEKGYSLEPEISQRLAAARAAAMAIGEDISAAEMDAAAERHIDAREAGRYIGYNEVPHHAEMPTAATDRTPDATGIHCRDDSVEPPTDDHMLSLWTRAEIRNIAALKVGRGIFRSSQPPSGGGTTMRCSTC